MLIMLIVNYGWFVGRQRVLVGQWSDLLSSATGLEAVSGRSTAGLPGSRVSQLFSSLIKKLHSREIYASGGGLLVAPRC